MLQFGVGTCKRYGVQMRFRNPNRVMHHVMQAPTHLRTASWARCKVAGV